MKKTTIIALAAALVALAEELKSETTAPAADPSPEPKADPQPEAKRKPGRPPKEEKKEEENNDDGDGGDNDSDEMTAAEFKEKFIMPLLKKNLGADVKKIVSKYASTGFADVDPKQYKALRKDLEALDI